MAFDLRSIKRGVEMAPPRIVLFGPHGVGKTTFAAHAPAPILLQTEEGAGLLDVPRFPEVAKSYSTVVEYLMALATQDHQFQTVALDSLDWLEPLVWHEACTRNNWANIESPGFGKGYAAADEVWREFLDAINYLRSSKGMQVILIAHTEIKAYNDPAADPYDRYSIKLQKRASGLVQEWADAVLFANFKTYTSEKDVGFNKKVSKGVGTGERVLYTEERPAFYAKNRYGLSPEISFSYAAFSAALSNQPSQG